MSKTRKNRISKSQRTECLKDWLVDLYLRNGKSKDKEATTPKK